ncbi:hypothetical protein POJ06DRAFT_113485 [Lipomyces tetrasporus]|uniref:Uncharacterized protein n=1 Tax=Lipomyces tetrasporus TaxID=54092 RepID=A0AAD7QQD1_9ASCO|nr:uncharacterized protein POJ06DRAFT_113485 [Lipomyces tetrasporus]KAJ8099627.1 hypothetical protein POJ06DRAFT_113485 [Lipomyces tetrasporus]
MVFSHRLRRGARVLDNATKVHSRAAIRASGLVDSGVCQWGENYNLSHYTPGLVTSFVFMYYIRRHYFGWWSKYNYVLTSGLNTAGVAFSALFILLTLHYTRTEFEWWGNLVSSAGVDGAVEDGLLEIPEDGFGLKKGEYW